MNSVVQRYKKTNRLRTKQDFKSVSLEGKRLYSDLFVLFLRRGKTAVPRLGITASRKCGKANKRNYFKRRVREIFRTHCSLLPQDLEIHIKLNISLYESDEVLYKEITTRLSELANETIERAAATGCRVHTR